MSVELRERRPAGARLVSWLLAPLVWVERAQGRRRLALLFAYALVLAVVGFLTWRAASLRGLPDIGDPFDVEEFAKPRLPDSENAYVLYEQAAGLLRRSPELPKLPPNRGLIGADWSSASPALRKWTEANHAVIDLFLQGADRRQAQSTRFTVATSGTLDPLSSGFQTLTQLVFLEGSRLESLGDLEEAWRHYRAVARASRHLESFGGWYEQWFALEMWQSTCNRMMAWSERPGITAPLLHVALADLAECEQMVPPASHMLKREYCRLRAEIQSPRGLARWSVGERSDPAEWWRESPTCIWAKHFLDREPERSLRVLRLIIAGELAQCDRPAAQRAPVLFGQYNIYAIDSHTPAALRTIPPEKLAKWAQSASLLMLPQFGFGPFDVEAERTAIARAGVEIAERCYLLEHGTPPKKYADLVGPYVKALPNGYTDDETPLGTETQDQNNKPGRRE